MIPNGKLLALVLAFAAVGGLVATGAFTSVEAERTADVEVGGDDGALLALQPVNNDSGASAFVSQDTAGSELTIDLSEDNINTNATTDAGGIINVTNNGNDAVGLNLSVSGGLVDSASDEVDVAFYVPGNTNGGTELQNEFGTYNQLLDDSSVLTGNDDSVTIAPGEEVTIGLAIEITGGQLDGVVFESVSFLAESETAGSSTGDISQSS